MVWYRREYKKVFNILGWVTMFIAILMAILATLHWNIELPLCVLGFLAGAVLTLILVNNHEYKIANNNK